MVLIIYIIWPQHIYQNSIMYHRNQTMAVFLGKICIQVRLFNRWFYHLVIGLNHLCYCVELFFKFKCLSNANWLSTMLGTLDSVRARLKAVSFMLCYVCSMSRNDLYRRHLLFLWKLTRSECTMYIDIHIYLTDHMPR